MSRSTICINGKNYPLYSVQTVVVGSGAAGLNAAVSLFKEGQSDVAVLTEGSLMGTSRNTGSDKQTYYKLTTCGSEPDNVRKMAQTLFDGQAMDGDLALAEAALSVRGFYHLVDIGVPFPCNGGGEYVGYKTDHDPNQRGTSAGPLTSKFMTEALWEEVKRYQIPVFDGYQVIEILTEKTEEGIRARGVLALNVKETEAQKQYTVFSADNVVYATGGEAGMYDTSVYPVSQTGGMGTAFRAGARGKNLTESQYGIASVKFRWNLSGTYQQVIPRYVSTDQEGNDEQEFLEPYFRNPQDLLYAVFLKGYQWPFDPRKTVNYGSSLIDLLVYQETVMKKRRVFLDYRRNPSCSMKEGCFEKELLYQEAYDYLKSSDGLWETPILRLEHMNPAAIELYRSHGIDLYEEMLEIAVCAQHNNGGLAGNWWWESNVRHLFPVGEVNGTHGVYRPGGSALNSGQVGSLRAAQFIAHCCKDAPLDAKELAAVCGRQIEKAVSFGMSAFEAGRPQLDLKAEKKKLGVRMSESGANIRSAVSVDKALKENRIQREEIESAGISEAAQMKHLYRLRDLLVSQQMYLEAISDYIARGGTSRGSYLIYDEKGMKPLDSLPDSFRFSLEDKGMAGQIQEIEYDSGACRCSWRVVRPIPEEDSWFEKVWRDYREGVYFCQ
ncbi:MAG: FAD-binding protein [Bariatricus sp.]